MPYIDLRLPSKEADQRLEDKLQQDCAAFVKKELYNRGLPQLFYHVANERKTSKMDGAKLKLKGVLSGVADVVIPFRNTEFSGLYIELKTRDGSPSLDQKKFLNGVADEGYLALVVNDLVTFKNCVIEYLNQR